MCQLAQCKLTVLLKLRHNLDSQHASMWLIANLSKRYGYSVWQLGQLATRLTANLVSCVLEGTDTNLCFESDLDTYISSPVRSKTKTASWICRWHHNTARGNCGWAAASPKSISFTNSKCTSIHRLGYFNVQLYSYKYGLNSCRKQVLTPGCSKCLNDYLCGYTLSTARHTNTERLVVLIKLICSCKTNKKRLTTAIHLLEVTALLVVPKVN